MFNLRGNQRTAGELSRKEGGKIFGSGARAPVAITILVKTTDHTGPATIHYHDIGDYLDQRTKLAIVKEQASIQAGTWQTITPNQHGDWINQRDDTFNTFPPLGEKRDKTAEPLFDLYSLGVADGARRVGCQFVIIGRGDKHGQHDRLLRRSVGRIRSMVRPTRRNP